MIMTDRNQGKFYNMQDLGLCKALAAAGHNVSLYNFVHGDTDEEIYVNDNLTLHYYMESLLAYILFINSIL